MFNQSKAHIECEQDAGAFAAPIVRKARAVYRSPALKDYGRIADLTAGGSSNRTSEVFNGCRAQAFLFRC